MKNPITYPLSAFILSMMAVLMLTGGLSLRADNNSTSTNHQSIRLPDEELHYKVLYKWGLIQKQAGKATLTLRGNPDNYVATLVGHSLPWADRIYKLRDTLRSTMHVDDMLPSKYERIAHEKDRYAHDIVEITRIENVFIGKATRHRKADSNAPVKSDSSELKAEGATVDLLSAFYYLRSLNFPQFNVGHKIVVNIFSGKQKEILNITYKGKEIVKIDNRDYQSYHVVFTFTSDGRKKSSSNINAWISADNRRIPLRLEGSLPIGKVQCIYVP